MAGEADVADLALLLGLLGRLNPAAGGEDHVRIGLVDDLVELPQIDHVGIESPQAVFEVLHGGFLIPAVMLGHEEDSVAIAVLQGFAHEHLGPPLVVLPCVVHERDAHVDGRANKADRLPVVLDLSDVMAAEPEDGDVPPGPAEHAGGHLLQQTDRKSRKATDLL